MKDWLTGKLKALLEMAISQRTVAWVVTMILMHILGLPSDKAAELGAALAAVLIASFAHRPPGAPVAATGLSPSLRPAVTVPSASGGVPQVVDPEEPKK